MSTDLDWEIGHDESDGEWEPARQAPPQPPPRAPREPRPPRQWRGPPRQWRRPHWSRRRWLLVAALAALLAVPLAWLAWQAGFVLQQQRQAVLRLAQLEDALAASGDTEALLSLQDPDYPGWREWQRMGMLGSTAGARGVEPLLHWNTIAAVPYSADGTPEYGDVNFDGRLVSVEVTRRYRAADAPGDAAPFVLRVRQYYRYVRGGWMHTGPPATGWIDTVRAPGKYLRFVYPRQDTGVVAPMAARLETLAAQVCRDIGCPSDQPSLVVSNDLAELVPAMNVALGQESMTAYLPAPSLVGMPGDADSAETLYRLYARRLVALAVANAANQQRLTIEPWLSWELAHLGLGAAPGGDVLREAARSGLAGGTLSIGRFSQADVWLALDFLAQNSGANPLHALFQPGSTPSERLAGELLKRQHAWLAYLQRIAVPAGVN